MTPDIEEKIKRDLIANPPQIFKENNASKPYHLPQTGYDIKLDEIQRKISELYHNFAEFLP